MSDQSSEIAAEALQNIQNIISSRHDGEMTKVRALFALDAAINGLDKIKKFSQDKKDQYNSRPWEYMVRYVGDMNPLTPTGLTSLLDQEGTQHWELVSHDSRIGLLILKRPKL